MFDPYKVAEEIDLKLNKLIESNPLTQENALDWLLLTRTIGTSLDLINIAAKEKIKFKYGSQMEDVIKSEDEKNISGC